MTAKELKKLHRSDLLEMLLALSKENEQLRKQTEQLQKQLDDRTIEIREAGSLAEAALRLNGFFDAAQAACEQYTENITQRYEQIEETCRKMEQETKEKCDAMVARAAEEAQSRLEEAERTIRERYGSYSWLTDIMDNTQDLVNNEE